MKKFMARQGDILIERIASLPDNAKEVEYKSWIVLAEGEVTGHAHTIKTTNRITKYFDLGDDVRAVAVKGRSVTVEHQEHAPIELDEGIYKVSRQKEYTPQAIRNVAD